MCSLWALSGQNVYCLYVYLNRLLKQMSNSSLNPFVERFVAAYLTRLNVLLLEFLTICCGLSCLPALGSSLEVAWRLSSLHSYCFCWVCNGNYHMLSICFTTFTAWYVYIRWMISFCLICFGVDNNASFPQMQILSSCYSLLSLLVFMNLHDSCTLISVKIFYLID